MLDAMRTSLEGLRELRVDGGAASMDLLCQSLADGTRLVVRRPSSVEATAIGAATIAGLAIGVLDVEELAASWVEDAAFAPTDATLHDVAYDTWLDAVGRARALAAQDPPRAT